MTLNNRWNTARVTADWLLEHPDMYRNRRTLELGAGAGLPSLAIAASGADYVVMTDYPDAPLLRNLEYNADCNMPGSSRQNIDVEVSQSVIAIYDLCKGFVWGANPKALLGKGKEKERDGPYDLILLSDVVFNHSQVRET